MDVTCGVYSRAATIRSAAFIRGNTVYIYHALYNLFTYLFLVHFDHLTGLTPASEVLQMSERKEEISSDEEHYESVHHAADGAEGGGEGGSIDMGLD